MNLTHCACGEPITTGTKCKACQENPMRQVLITYGKMTPQEADKKIAEDEQNDWLFNHFI